MPLHEHNLLLVAMLCIDERVEDKEVSIHLKIVVGAVVGKCHRLHRLNMRMFMAVPKIFDFDFILTILQAYFQQTTSISTSAITDLKRQHSPRI